MVDLLIMARERPIPAVYSGGTGELRSADEVLALKVRLEAAAAAEAEAWKGVTSA